MASITNLSPQAGVAILQGSKGAPGFSIPHPDAMRIMLRPMTNVDLKAVAACISSIQK